MSVPLVSVVVPAHQAERYLAEALDSALAQTHERIQVVVVDDGSTDGTWTVVERYLAAFPDQVVAVRQANTGTAGARNRGVLLAEGDYVVFLDADDRLLPTYVERCLALLVTRPEAGYVYTQERFFGDLDRLSDYPEFDADRLVHANFVNPSALLPIATVRSTPFTTRQRTHEDWDFWLNLLRKGVRGALLDEPLKEYRRHPAAKQAQAGRYAVRMPWARLRIHWRHRDLLGDPRAVLLADARGVALGVARGARTAFSLWVLRRRTS